MLYNNERIDDLECNGYRIIQSPDGYCFTSDSVLLANLCNIRKTDWVVDLCTGSGVIALLISAKYSPSIIYGVELQHRLADMAKRSVELNAGVGAGNVEIIESALQDINKKIGNNFDVVVCNPPYDYIEKDKEEYSEIEIAKSEAKVTLAEIISESAQLLKFGGLFYMINKSRRLVDVLFEMRNNNIEPKKIILIQPKSNKDIDTFIVEGKKGGKPSLLVPKPIIVYDDKGNYMEEVRRFYNKWEELYI